MGGGRLWCMVVIVVCGGGLWCVMVDCRAWSWIVVDDWGDCDASCGIVVDCGAWWRIVVCGG